MELIPELRARLESSNNGTAERARIIQCLADNGGWLPLDELLKQANTTQEAVAALLQPDPKDKRRKPPIVIENLT